MRDTCERMSGAEMLPWPTRPFTSNSHQRPPQEKGMCRKGALLLVISSDDSVCMPVLGSGGHLQNPRIPLSFLPSFHQRAGEPGSCWGLATDPQFGTSLLQGKWEQGTELVSPWLVYPATARLMTCSCHLSCKPQEQNARKIKKKRKKNKKRKKKRGVPARLGETPYSDVSR